MIDAHCHIDQIDSPEEIVREAEERAFTVIAVTNLPSHYAMALPHLKSCRYVRPALGFHPLMAAAHPQELMPFIRLAKTADYVGEIGLDLSEKGAPTKEAQVAVFDRILDTLKGGRRFITIHSRGAVNTVLDMLEQKQIGPVVFHWFTGSATQMARAIQRGHYFSLNPSMVRSASGSRLIAMVPGERVLTETDAPFTRISGRAALPWDVDIVLRHISTVWNKSLEEVEQTVEHNFARLMH